VILFNRSGSRRAAKFTISISKLKLKVNFQVIIYYYEAPLDKLIANTKSVDLAMDLPLSKRAKTGENQHIANFKPPISTNTTVTNKKAQIYTRRLLCC